eukprot:gene1912-1157_t
MLFFILSHVQPARKTEKAMFFFSCFFPFPLLFKIDPSNMAKQSWCPCDEINGNFLPMSMGHLKVSKWRRWMGEGCFGVLRLWFPAAPGPLLRGILGHRPGKQGKLRDWGGRLVFSGCQRLFAGADGVFVIFSTPVCGGCNNHMVMMSFALVALFILANMA